MNVTKELLEDIIEDLRGSCKSLEQSCEDHEVEVEDLTESDYLRIDEVIFCCEGCNWWFEVSEMSEHDSHDRWVCNDCAEKEDDETD